MHPFKDYHCSTAATPRFPFYQGEVMQNLLRYLKYRDIIVNDKILTVIEVYPDTLEFEVIMDGQVKKFFINSKWEKVQLMKTAQMFIVDYINTQKKK